MDLKGMWEIFMLFKNGFFFMTELFFWGGKGCHSPTLLSSPHVTPSFLYPLKQSAMPSMLVGRQISFRLVLDILRLNAAWDEMDLWK